MSPQVGELDETAFEQALAADPDAALSMLAEMAAASDERLRSLARRLAGRVVVRLGSAGSAHQRGVGRLRRVPLAPGRELDVEASMDGLLAARAVGQPPLVEDLRASDWGRPAVALCLLVDRSGSVGGQRLAAAALAAAVVAMRAPHDHSVVVFNDAAIVLTAQGERRDVEAVVGELLALRGTGTTDLALALEAARRQLERSSARRRLTVLLSDGRRTAGPDPVAAAARLDELLVLAPADDAVQAQELANAVGGRLRVIAGPADVPRALRALVD